MNWWSRQKKLLVRSGLVLLVFVFVFSFYKTADAYFLRRIEEKTYWERFALRQTVLLKRYESSKPILKPAAARFETTARAALVIEMKPGGEEVLFSYRETEPVPIASLTKLMNALVVLERYDLDGTIVFSEEAASKEGGPNFFREGERFTVRQLLRSSLVESSNRAAYALAEEIGTDRFVGFMNKRAQELGMENTRFFNPTGLDPDFEYEGANYSTAQDMVYLIKALHEEPLVREASRAPVVSIYNAEGGFHHAAENTNRLLSALGGEVHLAKTGTTPIAGSCLVLSFDNPRDGEVLIAVVLGAGDNFAEMNRLLNWIYDSYNF